MGSDVSFSKTDLYSVTAHLKTTADKNRGTPIVGFRGYETTYQPEPLSAGSIYTAVLPERFQKADIVSVMQQLGLDTAVSSMSRGSSPSSPSRPSLPRQTKSDVAMNSRPLNEPSSGDDLVRTEKEQAEQPL